MVKPRIAIIHYSAPPVVGGVEQIIRDHANSFVSNKYNVKIVAGKGNQFHKKVAVKIIPQMLAFDPLNVSISSELDKGIVSNAFRSRAAFFYRKLRKELKDREIVIIHNVLTMHFNMPLTAALVKIIRNSSGKKFISWTHDLTFRDISYQDMRKNRYPLSLLRTRLRNVKYVCVSKFRRDQLAGLFKVQSDAIEVIPNGLDVRRFLRLKMETMRIIDTYKFLDSDLILLYPVRLTRNKNIELAIRVTHAINSLGTDTVLIVTGTPDIHNRRSLGYYDSLRALADKLNMGKKIIFLHDYQRKHIDEVINSDVVFDLYKLCDMLIFPSRQEGFGLPILEAGMARMPIACSEISPFRETGNGHVCFFKLSDSPGTIARKIIRYLKSESKLPALFRKIERDYRWQTVFRERIKPLLRFNGNSKHKKKVSLSV